MTHEFSDLPPDPWESEDADHHPLSELDEQDDAWRADMLPTGDDASEVFPDDFREDTEPLPFGPERFAGTELDPDEMPPTEYIEAVDACWGLLSDKIDGGMFKTYGVFSDPKRAYYTAGTDGQGLREADEGKTLELAYESPEGDAQVTLDHKKQQAEIRFSDPDGNASYGRYYFVRKTNAASPEKYVVVRKDTYDPAVHGIQSAPGDMLPNDERLLQREQEKVAETYKRDHGITDKVAGLEETQFVTKLIAEATPVKVEFSDIAGAIQREYGSRKLMHRREIQLSEDMYNKILEAYQAVTKPGQPELIIDSKGMTTVTAGPVAGPSPAPPNFIFMRLQRFEDAEGADFTQAVQTRGIEVPESVTSGRLSESIIIVHSGKTIGCMYHAAITQEGELVAPPVQRNYSPSRTIMKGIRNFLFAGRTER